MSGIRQPYRPWFSEWQYHGPDNDPFLPIYYGNRNYIITTADSSEIIVSACHKSVNDGCLVLRCCSWKDDKPAYDGRDHSKCEVFHVFAPGSWVRISMTAAMEASRELGFHGCWPQSDNGNGKRASNRKKLTPSMRHKVLKRDGFKCRHCGASGDEQSLEVDHILPVSRGGTNTMGNLQTLCSPCNRGKRDEAP